LEGAVEFIENLMKKKDKVVLVHCQAGISRSATVVIGCLMRLEEGMTVDEALRKVRMVRQGACPNVSFIEDLWEFWKKEQLKNIERKGIGGDIGSSSNSSGDSGSSKQIEEMEKKTV
jgi:protein-tyrosine phosphatase